MPSSQKLQAQTTAEVTQLLKQAEIQITNILENEPSDYEQWRLKQVQTAIAQVMREFRNGTIETLTGRAQQAVELGTDLVDTLVAPLIVGTLPKIDTHQLIATKKFLTQKITEITQKGIQQINGQLGLTVIGSQSVTDTVTRISDILDSDRQRAITITRTELGRAYSSATQSRLEQMAKRGVPNLRKEWRASGKRNGRPEHQAAHGQIVDWDKPFLIGGDKLMHPLDPQAPAKQTINCGCVCIPVVGD